MDTALIIIAIHAGIIGCACLLSAAAEEIDDMPDTKRSTQEVFLFLLANLLSGGFWTPSGTTKSKWSTNPELRRSVFVGMGLMIFCMACIFYLGIKS